MTRFPRNSILVVALTAAVANSPSADAQPVDAPAPRDAVAELEAGVANLDDHLKRIKGKTLPIPADEDRRKVLALLDSTYCGPRHFAATGPRFFVARLVIVNLTREPATWKRENVSLQVDGKTLPLKDVPGQHRSAGIAVASGRQTLGGLKQDETLTVPPGKSGETWIAFTDLPGDNASPKLRLQMKFGDRTETLDVNEFSRKRLGLTVERIGPGGGLGLLTIAGELNTVNLSDLIDETAALLKEKPPVKRFVVRWTKSADPVESRMRGWLQQEAGQIGRPNNNTFGERFPYPPFPSTIAELHLAGLPSTYGSSNRVHKSSVDAVAAILKDAYLAIPPDEVVREIEQGHPLTRAAALAGGGGRLPAEKLPLLLKYTRHDDRQLQLAALQALRHFGEKSAIDRLTELARKVETPAGRAAVASLASSRFASAHRTLLAELEQAPPKSQREIVKILAKHPRPVWSDAIYQFVNDPESELGAEALTALGRIGHPKIVDVLERSLKHKEADVRAAAFQQLAKRRDERSERSALEYALERLKTESPDSNMLQLMTRIKDPRCVPLLIERLDDDKTSGKSGLIDAISQIGDQSVAAELAKRYPKFEREYDKAAVLRALIRLQWPDFMKLARDAVMSKNSSLVQAACEGLRADAGPEAVQLLIDAFEKSESSSSWSYAANSLGEIGTTEARRALVAARDGDNEKKSSYAVNALRNMRHRSPAYQYYYQGKRTLRDNDLKSTLKYCEFALSIDDNATWAFGIRGHVRLKQKDFKRARKDLETAYKDDPYDLYAASGMALLQIRDGEFRKAVKSIEDKGSRISESDGNKKFQMARIYSQAMKAAGKVEDKAERKKLVQDFRKKALENLTQSVKYGRNHSDGYGPEDARSEADFAPLKDLPEFKKLIGPAQKPKAAKPGEAGDEAANAPVEN